MGNGRPGSINPGKPFEASELLVHYHEVAGSGSEWIWIG